MARKPSADYAAYFGHFGAILRDYKPYYEYKKVIDQITGEEKSVKTDNKLGMTVLVVSRLLGFAHISVKIAGDTGTFEHPDIDEAFDTQKLICVEFENFKGGSYDRNGVTHYNGTATAVRIVPDPMGADGKPQLNINRNKPQ